MQNAPLSIFNMTNFVQYMFAREASSFEVCCFILKVLIMFL